MGTDIHIVMQAKNKAGKWVTTCQQPSEDRNYVTFDIYAGGRGDDPSLQAWPNRGLPEDFDIPADFYYWDDDRATWLLASEIIEKWESMPDEQRMLAPLMGEHVKFFRDFALWLDPDQKLDNIRLVIAFDN